MKNKQDNTHKHRRTCHPHPIHYYFLRCTRPSLILPTRLCCVVWFDKVRKRLFCVFVSSLPTSTDHYSIHPTCAPLFCIHYNCLFFLFFFLFTWSLISLSCNFFFFSFLASTSFFFSFQTYFNDDNLHFARLLLSSPSVAPIHSYTHLNSSSIRHVLILLLQLFILFKATTALEKEGTSLRRSSIPNSSSSPS